MNDIVDQGGRFLTHEAIKSLKIEELLKSK